MNIGFIQNFKIFDPKYNNDIIQQVQGLVYSQFLFGNQTCQSFEDIGINCLIMLLFC